MKEKGKVGDAAKRPIPERLAEIRKLSREFHGVEAIPDEEVARLGYVRFGLNHLVPREIVTVRRTRTRIALEASRDEHPEKAPPFGRVEVVLPATKEKYRELQVEEFETLQGQLDRLHPNIVRPYREPINPDDAQRIEEVMYFYKEKLPSQQPLLAFMDQFASYLDKITDDEFDKVLLMKSLFYHSTAATNFNERLKDDDEVGEGGFYLDPELFSFNMFGEEVISPERAKELWQHLERKKGQLADPVGLSSFQSDEIENDDPLGKYLTQQRAPTTFTLMRQLFGNFLASRGMEGIAAQVQEGQTAAEISETLAKAATSNDVLHTLRLREKEIKGQLKNVDEETRHRLAAELSRIKQDRKKVRQLLEGMVSYFDTPALFTDFVRRTISEAQKLLVIPIKGDAQLQMTLDASPDPIRDANPGRISGDCTQDKPLPFADPSVPIFNVKVLVEKDHIGNIYLLETQTTQGEPAWHLEAIQIPSRAVDWNNAIPPLVNALAAQAEREEVKKITVNNSSSGISNYRYISAAIEDYYGSHNGGATAEIIVPKGIDEEQYSAFQGNGTVLVLWSQENQSQ